MKCISKLLCGAVCLALGAGGAWAADAVKPKLGAKVSDFSLQDFRGAPHKLSEVKDAKLVVVAFMGVECPISKLYAPRLAELAAKYDKQGVKFIAVDANRQDAVTEMGYFAKEHNIEFPFLKDTGNKLADEMGASRVPQVFVLDGERAIRYSGRIDDEYGFDTGSGYAKTRVTSSDLTNALDELLAGKQVTTTETQALGCLIGRILTPNEKSEVTYSNQIARIFADNCVDCHRPGQIGPFALQSYEEAAGWAEMIDEVVRDRRMPPWHIDEGVGHWRNDASLSKDEKELIHKWVAAGAPEGNPKDLPEGKKYVEGWQLVGGPDMVLYMSENEVDIKATGTEPYRNYRVATGFTEDKWVCATEIKPSNYGIVHHIIVYVNAPGGAGGGGGLGNNLTGYAPGARRFPLPPGYAKLIPAGSSLTFQMHYTPNGTPQKDRSCIGLKFADPETVTHRVFTSNATNASFRIPANDPNFKVTSNAEYRNEVTLLSLFPHMHVRGKAFNYELTYPDGTKETLLTMSRYDFNWQTSYVFSEPKQLPAGTKLECVAHFDNSTNNPANPDPNKTVTWGDQTWEEMMIGWFDYAMPKDANPNGAVGGGFGGGRGAGAGARGAGGGGGGRQRPNNN